MVLIVGVASAYVLTIDCPSKLPVGAPLPVTGTTSFPVGTTFDLVFSSLRPDLKYDKQYSGDRRR